MRDLSGGEKGRLALAKLIYSGVNVLVLDEPTNHLDIPSREALEAALEAYEGTIVTISHDRFFLDRVATQILALDGEGHVEHYNGDYTEYHDWKAAKSEPPAVGGGPTDETFDVSEARASARAVSGKRASRDDRRRGSSRSVSADAKRIKVIKKARDSEVIEAEIAEAEKRLKDLSDEMAKPEVARDITKLVQVNDEYKQAEAGLAELMDEWERAETAATPTHKKSARR